MCEIIAGQNEEDYRMITRSVRLHGHVTSVRLERFFWEILEGIARRERLSDIPQLLNKLQDEILDLKGEPPANFAALLRVGCVKYLNNKNAG
jgi:predicted DNA-binding ribbon-helix-helix protein